MIDMLNKFVIVRTYSAGVHCGTLKTFDGKFAVLENSRRIWSWDGGNTLNELAVTGAGENSRISQPVEQIALTEAIEVIICTPTAEGNLTRSRWK